HSGTLFLDEVAEIAPEVQAKLLRFLQFGEIQRLGSDRTERVDVRVVAATHQDLKALVDKGKFRQHLYFPLNLIAPDLPPLRERLQDVPLLPDAFIKRYWKRGGHRPRFTNEVHEVLASYAFPGNVRELGHIVERACVLASSTELGMELLPPELGGTIPTVGSS